MTTTNTTDHPNAACRGTDSCTCGAPCCPSALESHPIVRELTADTITDDDIEQLKNSVGAPDRDYLTSEEQKIVSLCNVALIEGSRLGLRARQRCANVINHARAQAES